MDGSGSNLTIDFSDASFDNSDANEQPIPGVDNIDVVFPLDDNGETTVGSGEYEKTGNDFSDNRTSTTAPAQAIALMPNDSIASAMDEFIFEFDNDENDDGDTTTTDQGLKITSKAEGPSSTMQELNLEGAFENLHDGGTLDVHVAKDDGNGGKVYEMVTLGMSESNQGTTGTVVGGDMNGADMAAGDDAAVINVDATTVIQGMYKGGSGYDTLQLVEGVREDNGAIVDFYFGDGGPSSAAVTPASNMASDVAFQIDGWESIQLTDNADSIYISGNVGVGLTDTYDTSYWNPGSSNSMLKLQTGYTDGGDADVVKVNADSNVYLSFEFANDSDIGIDAHFFSNDTVDIYGIGGSASSPTIDVDIEKTGGSGLTIDYLETTSNSDRVMNHTDIGIMVDLGGSSNEADIFDGSSSSENDVLDARAVQNLEFSSQMADPYINVKSVDGGGVADNLVNAKLSEVDYIMVTDQGDDIDFYQDMSELNGSQIIDGLGAGAMDAYGAGYDVITSAQVNSFGTEGAKRVYYEGDHNDFVDVDDDITYTDGNFTMSTGDTQRGSLWESQVESQYGPGQEPGFYIEVGGKKLAVTMDHEKNAWKVDTTAIKVAEDANANIDISGINTAQFASDVLARYGLNPAESMGSGSMPMGSGSMPMGSGSMPMGSGSMPMGSGSMPMGSGSMPMGSGSMPMGSGSMPMGSGSMPMGSDSWSMGSGSMPMGSGSMPMGSGSMPMGSDYWSMGSGSMPMGSGSMPMGSGSMPMGSGSMPMGSGSMPMGSGSMPMGSGSMPMGSGSMPMGSELMPNGYVNQPEGNHDFITIQSANGSNINHSFSNDIYLNASEEAIQQLLSDGYVSDRAFNFTFYTKMDVETDQGDVTVNIKLQDSGSSFYIDTNDIDVAVESFYNVAENAGAAVTSSSSAGEFVKIDNSSDIALGNGGDDTYVVGDDGADIYGGIALEYGNLGQNGGLTGSIDAVNFNSVDSVSELTFRRGELRNEEEGSSLFISQLGGTNETVLFDNYNEYLDFRRVEYLTVEDGANNDEIYEIVTTADDNISDWDNEIYVANGGSMDIQLGGIDYVFGSDDADTFNVSLSDIMSAGNGTINLSNVTSDDTINVADAASAGMGEADIAQMNATLEAGLASGGGQVTFSYSDGVMTLGYNSDDDALDIANQQFNI